MSSAINTVSNRLTNPHPLVAATKKAAVGTRPDGTGRLLLGARGSTGIKVSRSALPRALRVLDAIYKGAEARGWQVVAGQKYKGLKATKVVSGDHDVIITIHEGTTKTPHVPNKSEQARIDKRDTYGIPEHDHEPNGRLHIKLIECDVAKRSNWSDGARQNVENLIEDVLDGIQSAFTAYEERDAESERQEHERRQRRIVALESAYQRLVHTRRVEAVMEQSRTWRQAEDLRAYATEVRLRAERAGGTPPEVQEWLEWVQRHLDEVLDPPGHLPTLTAPPSRDDKGVVEYLNTGRGNWSQAWLDWTRA